MIHISTLHKTTNGAITGFAFPQLAICIFFLLLASFSSSAPESRSSPWPHWRSYPPHLRCVLHLARCALQWEQFFRGTSEKKTNKMQLCVGANLSISRWRILEQRTHYFHFCKLQLFLSEKKCHLPPKSDAMNSRIQLLTDFQNTAFNGVDKQLLTVWISTIDCKKAQKNGNCSVSLFRVPRWKISKQHCFWKIHSSSQKNTLFKTYNPKKSKMQLWPKRSLVTRKYWLTKPKKMNRIGSDQSRKNIRNIKKHTKCLKKPNLNAKIS